MGRRSGVVEHESGLARLSMAEIDAEIARCRTRAGIASGTRQRKAFESRIHWLERYGARRSTD